MSKIAPLRFGFCIIILVAAGSLTALPLLQSAGMAPGVAAAFADDDNDGGGDDDGGGGYNGSSGGGDRGSDDRRPRGDLRSLFGWPFQRAERRPQQRRAVAIPDHAPDKNPGARPR
ncbi:exported hypothetical protein [Agrobacterium deltaense NCPPB 1641]|uniref:Uncharacterized protein n=1 Tax=Agrobacterium deltaense NCPPB 1641 TaxID=1183425 RepID=A0A1S7TV73_9HYPH|nr:exported hypothetical protein [Agrobacterium deltaense NCPPB 1641]